MRGLVEERYEQLSPGLFAAVLAGSTELHPLATDVATGAAVDLHGAIADEPSLRLALRASAALPFLAGDPVALDGGRFVDAGLSAAIPFRAALADGATHVLVLRSRIAGEAVAPAGPAAAPRSRARCSVASARRSRPRSARGWSASRRTRRCWPSTTPTRRASR